MLPRARRLRAAEVREVLARGRGRTGTTLSTKVLPTTSAFRCAVVVSKKLARSAVLRNKLRRAAYRALHNTSLPRTGHAILFVRSVPKTNLTDVFSSELKKLLHV